MRFDFKIITLILATITTVMVINLAIANMIKNYILHSTNSGVSFLVMMILVVIEFLLVASGKDV